MEGRRGKYFQIGLGIAAGLIGVALVLYLFLMWLF
jgi:hypothetical protein